jgi:hypothetical protein
VLEALWILVKGFDAAGAPPAEPQHSYGGLITVLLRLVFLLYAEDEELMPADSLYGQQSSVSGLELRLRQDRAEHQGQMEGRLPGGLPADPPRRAVRSRCLPLPGGPHPRQPLQGRPDQGSAGDQR